MEALFTREIRLGIVMCGGASLAVYENGIAQELFRAVKGEGIYGTLKRLMDSEIVIDILSGTSAGGINGILLSYALANNKDFRATAALWRKQANVFTLLRNYEHLQSLLESALREMADYAGPRYASELDLFVTGTDVYGRVSRARDDLGRPMAMKDHRTVFMLSYRGERKNEFAPANISALAKLARITACVPVVFPPVAVKKCTADWPLWRWGRLSGQAYFLDGGILDNKPFSYVIDTISRRISARGCDRLLLYVDPSPELVAGTPERMPGPVDTVVRALSTIPRFRSINADWKTIADHNRTAAQWQSLREALGRISARPSRAQWRMYLRARRASPCGDVDFRRRRLAHVIAAIQNEHPQYADMLICLKRQFEILEMIEFSIQTQRTEWDLLPVDGICGRGVGSLLNQCDRQERAILRKLPERDPVREEYRCFLYLDAYVFPVEHIAGLSAKELIRTVRISPLAPEKVRGRKLGHFAGFFKESWRAADLLQGRLDGAAQLIECILAPARPRGMAFSRELVQGLIRAAHREIFSSSVP